MTGVDYEPLKEGTIPDVRVLEDLRLMTVLKGPENQVDGVKRVEYVKRLRRHLGVNIASKQSVENAIRWMATARSALDSVSQFLAEEVLELRCWDDPPRPSTQHPGILGLPDEILLTIMERTITASWPPDYWDSRYQNEALNLSHVCHRFRRLALQSPPIWTRITSLDSIERTLMHLKLSKNYGLHVHFCDGHSVFETAPPMSFLEAVIDQRHRWRSFEFEINANCEESPESMPSFLSSLSPLCIQETYPTLRTFALRSRSHWSEGDDSWDWLSEADRGMSHFYTDWKCPNLETVALRNFVPRDSPIFSSPLRNMELEYDNEDHDAAFDIDIVLDILRRQPLLQELEVRLSMFDVSPSASPLVKLDKVSRLILPCFVFEGNMGGVGLLMDRLSLPNVSQLEISVDIDHWHNLCNCLNAVIFNRHPLNSLKIITLKIVRSLTGSSCQLQRLMELPNLSHLSLTVDDIMSGRSALWLLGGTYSTVSPLQVLHLSGCDGFHNKDIAELLDLLEVHGKLDDFRRLEVYQSPCFLKQNVEAFLPPSKIVWVD